LATEAVKRASHEGCPNHPIDLKRLLSALACEPEESVAKLTLTHGINANLLFK
jgi:transposase-like protein